jgi:hypothetical protein
VMILDGMYLDGLVSKRQCLWKVSLKELI